MAYTPEQQRAYRMRPEVREKERVRQKLRRRSEKYKACRRRYDQTRFRRPSKESSASTYLQQVSLVASVPPYRVMMMSRVLLEAIV